MTTARAAVVGVAASRALGEGTNALPEARAIAKMIIRMKATVVTVPGRPLYGWNTSKGV